MCCCNWVWFVVIGSIVVGIVVIRSVVPGGVVVALPDNNKAGGTAIDVATRRIARMTHPINFQSAGNIICWGKNEQKTESTSKSAQSGLHI